MDRYLLPTRWWRACGAGKQCSNWSNHAGWQQYWQATRFGLVCATNRDLEADIANGGFRAVNGGVKRVWNATGVARSAILAGLKELEQLQQEQQEPASERRRVRRPGAGRKKLLDQNPMVRDALERLVEPTAVGDPETPLRWTCKSLMHLSRELRAQGHTISHVSVGALLKEMGYGLQGNRKTLEGSAHPDRNAQFEFINQKADAALLAGEPVISVDTKKKELAGQFKNGGKEWRPEGEPEKVNVYDFIDKELGRANPYGVYDLAHNNAWVSVGTDHDTASFAVSTIQRWWRAMGSKRPAVPPMQRA